MAPRLQWKGFMQNATLARSHSRPKPHGQEHQRHVAGAVCSAAGAVRSAAPIGTASSLLLCAVGAWMTVVAVCGCSSARRDAAGPDSGAARADARPNAGHVDAAVAAAPDAGTTEGPEITVLQYNLYGWNALVQNPWKGENMVALINTVGPDFLTAQECEGRSEWVRERLTGDYALSGPEQHGVAIFYRADRWDLADSGVVLLDEMDEWGQRILRWGRFTHRESGRGLYIYTSHWCVCSESQLLGSAMTVAASIATREHANEPVVFTGDLNVFEGFEDSAAIRYLKGELGSPIALDDTFRIAHPDANGSTFGDAGKIDYVFATPAVEVLGASIDRTSIPPGSGSDHEPVTATIRL